MKRSKQRKGKYRMYKNIKMEGKRSTMECKEIAGKPDATWNKGSGHLKERPHPAKFPNYEKKSRKRLGPGMVMQTFNSRTQKAPAGGYLRKRPARFTERVPGQSSLGSEGNH